ncbi:MAG: TetR/AcrR family transcriptional regulator [Bdellovibrionota bacterium]
MARRKPLSPRKKPLQRRSQEMVDVILEAATRVFIEEGYEGASTNKIARRAGVSVGSLYQYFPNKEAITAALFDQLSVKAIRLVQERLGKLAHAPLPQAISEAVGILAELYRSSPELIEMTFERLSELERTRQLQALRERSAAVLLAYLQTRQNELRPGDLPHMSWVVSSAVEALVFRVMQETPTHLSQKKLLSEISELIGRYLTD